MMTPQQIKWIEALESGRYKQGSGKLEMENRFCCLGVACDIFKDELKLERRENINKIALYNNSVIWAPDEVVTHLNLRGCEGQAKDTNSCRTLATLNDTGISFTQIAALLRTHPEQYFTNYDTQPETT